MCGEIPGKAGKEIRRQGATQLCRLYGADLSLIAELEERHRVIEGTAEEKFFKGADGNELVNFRNKQVVYLGKVEPPFLKYGFTDDMQGRSRKHNSDFGVFELIAAFETANNREVERVFKETLDLRKLRKSAIINGKMQTELVEMTGTFSEEDCKTMLRDVVKDTPHPQVQAQQQELELLKLDKQLLIETQKTKQIQETEMTKRVQIQETEATKRLEIKQRCQISEAVIAPSSEHIREKRMLNECETDEEEVMADVKRAKTSLLTSSRLDTAEDTTCEKQDKSTKLDLDVSAYLSRFYDFGEDTPENKYRSLFGETYKHYTEKVLYPVDQGTFTTTLKLTRPEVVQQYTCWNCKPAMTFVGTNQNVGRCCTTH